MGILEQILTLRAAVDTLLVVSLQTEESQIRIGQHLKENLMDAVALVAAAKQIDDATTAMGTNVGIIAERIKAMAKIISDNVTGNQAVEDAVAQLFKDAPILTATAAALAAIATDPANPVPVPVPTPNPQDVG